MTNPQQDLLQLFQTHGGYLTSQEVRAAGIPTMYLTLLERKGLIERLQRGVYRCPAGHTAPVNSTAADLLEVQLRVPYARPCLTTALNLHDLTTTRPAALQFAIPANRRFPDLNTRHGAGLAAALFLLVFCFLAWGAYQNVWRDIKH